MAELGSILLAEDDPDDVDLILMGLKEHNLVNEVAVTHDGEEALEYLYRRGRYENRAGANPILVLLDLKMPKVDGLEVLKQIKSDSHLKTIPVVMLTSSLMEADQLSSYNSGANAYIVKPVNFTEFVDAVKKLGAFWAILNEPPPDALQSSKH